jgi:hypothetical protein
MELDKSQLPASVIQAAMLDPATGTNAPPNFGQEVVPHIYTASGRYGIASQSYLNMDEALRDSRQNAERMRADCGIMECIEQRQRAVALLPWHIKPDDDKDPRQVELAAAMTKILEKTPRFTELRRNLLEAIWFGRSAVANQFGPKQIGNKWRTVVRKWEPRHADKLVFRYDDGSHDVDPEQIGIRVSTTFRNSYIRSSVGSGIHSKIMPTEMGLVYWLDRWERQTMIVHKHMVEDGPYEDPRMAGRIHGIGIRDRIYWTWYAMVECLQRVVEYLDRAAFGIEVWPYQQGNPQSKAATEKAAFGAMGGGRTVIMAPIPPGPDDPDRYMPKLIEPGLGGVAQTMEIIRTYFGHKIKRYILGQTLSSEAESTGMGSGVADAHLATFADILSYDARNLEETITSDFLRPMQVWNFRDTVDIDLQFVIDTESDNVKERLQAIKSAWDMGLRIQADELYSIIGTAKPTGDDETLQNPQIAQASMMAAQQGGIQQGANGGAMISPETFHESFMKHMAGNKWAT